VATRAEWADAYYEQAYSDWRLFTELQGRRDVPSSHALHHLQMATEKLAKVCRFRDSQGSSFWRGFVRRGFDQLGFPWR